MTPTVALRCVSEVRTTGLDNKVVGRYTDAPANARCCDAEPDSISLRQVGELMPELDRRSEALNSCRFETVGLSLAAMLTPGFDVAIRHGLASWSKTFQHNAFFFLSLSHCTRGSKRWLRPRNLKQSGDNVAARSPSVLSIRGYGARDGETLKSDPLKPEAPVEFRHLSWGTFFFLILRTGYRGSTGSDWPVCRRSLDYNIQSLSATRPE
ncbi:hypothetical protein LIA77_00219 [Sarocladium implicatum]|nr:hypothetical protein LIA77_00219 [Sarocladium implicatum]